MSKAARARAKAKKRLERAQNKTGLSKKAIKRIMRSKNLGKRLDSTNELKKLLRTVKYRESKKSDNKINTKAESYTNKAIAETGLSQASVNDIAEQLGIGPIDSANDVYKVNKAVKKQENERITSSGKYTGLLERYNALKEKHNINKESFQNLQKNYDTRTGEYTKLSEDYATSQSALTESQAELEQSQADYTESQTSLTEAQADLKASQERVSKLNEQIGGYDKEISGYKDKISGYDTKISKYATDFSALTDKYAGVVGENTSLTKERDEAKEAMQKQSEEFEAAKSERDLYREQSIGQQLQGLRGGATYGGANQTSYGSGNLASGRSGYSSNTRDRDKGLADYVMAEGGATDSVLNREGPVVEMMNKGGGGGGQSTRAIRRPRNVGGTGSYYASRFGG